MEFCCKCRQYLSQKTFASKGHVSSSTNMLKTIPTLFWCYIPNHQAWHRLSGQALLHEPWPMCPLISDQTWGTLISHTASTGGKVGTHWILGPLLLHDDVMKWKHFPRYWPFVRGIHRSPVNSPHKGQWRRALMFSLICVWPNGWVNNRDADDLRCHRVDYDVIVMPNDGYGLNDIWTCISNYSHYFMWDVITYPWSYFNSGLNNHLWSYST